MDACRSWICATEIGVAASVWLELQGVAIEKLSMQAGVATSTQADAADAAAPDAMA